MKCPLCQSETFFVKDPEDEYTAFKFTCSDGEIRFDSEVDVSDVPQVHDKTEAYCINCAWHGRFDMLKKPRPS
jgi:hypothetical protein